MKKFTLFNNKWHPIRFIFWIFATKIPIQPLQIDVKNCKMQAFGPVLVKKVEKRYREPPWNEVPAVEHYKKCKRSGGVGVSVGDEVAAVAGHDAVLAHTHLVLDG